MKNDKYVIDDTRPFVKGGKKLGTHVFLRNETTQEQKTRTYLNPYGKGKKYARENKERQFYTNLGTPKSDKPWSREAQAYRAGYMDAQKDAAAIWKYNNSPRNKNK